jgi:hypothetical protein
MANQTRMTTFYKYVGLNMFSIPGRPVAAEGRLRAVSWRADVMAGIFLPVSG